MAEGGHIALANGGQFTLVLGGQFAWIFQLAKLDQHHIKEEKALSEIADIRERLSNDREQDTEHSSRSFEPDSEDRERNTEDRCTEDEEPNHLQHDSDEHSLEDEDDVR
jgi:hypothetical protein